MAKLPGFTFIPEIKSSLSEGCPKGGVVNNLPNFFSHHLDNYI